MPISVTVGASGGFWSPPIIAAIISGLIALVTGSVVGTIAYRQWKTAKDKLAIDLFDRRYAVWSRGNAAYTQALRELPSISESRQPSFFPSPGLAEFGRAKEDAYFLFGVEVVQHWSKVEMALFQLGLGLRRPREMFEADDAFDQRMARDELYSQQAQQSWDDLKRSIEPYMMMSHISVNLPATQTKSGGLWPWSDRASKT